MVHKVKKRTLFFLGLAITSLVGLLGLRTKDTSLLVSLVIPEAQADVSLYAIDGGGDCGGCSAGDSADSGGSDGDCW
jgi:hypothetical protein